MEKQLVDREVDKNRFRRLFTNSRPKMPDGYASHITIAPTRQLIRERCESLTERA